MEKTTSRRDSSPDDIVLAHAGASILRGRAGDEGGVAAVVVAYRKGTMRPVAGVKIRFRSVIGELSVGPSAVTTDARGRATARVAFRRRGAGIVDATAAGNLRTSIAFEARSEGVADRIQIISEPAYPADGGTIRFTAVVADHLGEPVDAARLHATGCLAPDTVVQARMRRVGRGRYACALKTRRAGEWSLEVADKDTHAVGRGATRMTPGEPVRIAVPGPVDPRAWSPRDRLNLRAALVDRHGNALDPQRLKASCLGKPLDGWISGSEARFPVAMKGHGERRVRVWDSESRVGRRVVVPFAAAVLSDPGLVKLGSTFSTDVFLFPTDGKAVRKALVRVRFDPERARFKMFTPAPGARQVAHSVEGRILTLTIESRVPLTEGRGGDGCELGRVEWVCCGEGETWFTTSAVMSPVTPGWDKCVLQKVFGSNECLCVNIVYNDAAGKAAGEAVADQIDSVISGLGNLSRCCPDLDVEIHFAQITAHEWTNAVRGAIGADGKVSSQAEYNALIALGLHRRAKCINIYMIDVDAPTFGGQVDAIGGSNIVLDPGLPGSRPNVGAHEVGHCLGLPDAYTMDASGTVVSPGPTDGLMSYPHGDRLERGDCRTIWANIGKFKC